MKRSEMYCLVNKLLILCQVVGVAPILESNKSSGIAKRLHHIWCLTIIIYIYVFNYRQLQYLDKSLPTFVRFFNLSELSTNCLIVTVTISSIYYYASHYRSISVRLLDMYKKLSLYLTDVTPLFDVLYKELHYLFAFTMCFHISCFSIDLVYNQFNVLTSIHSSSVYNLPNVLISLNLGQYWLALRFINLLYERLNATIRKQFINTSPAPIVETLVANKDFLSYSGKIYPWQNSLTAATWYQREFVKNDRTPNASDYEVLEYLRDIYSSLDSLLAEVVQVFALIILLNFIGSFLDMTIQYFAIYKYFDKPKAEQALLISYRLLWIILHTGRMFFVLLTNNAIIREKCNTCFILNEINTTSSKDLEHAVNRFILQLMVRKRTESACGVFDLDLLFLGGIASALATYVIFLIQIDLGNESMAGAAALNSTN